MAGHPLPNTHPPSDSRVESGAVQRNVSPPCGDSLDRVGSCALPAALQSSKLSRDTERQREAERALGMLPGDELSIKGGDCFPEARPLAAWSSRAQASGPLRQDGDGTENSLAGRLVRTCKKTLNRGWRDPGSARLAQNLAILLLVAGTMMAAVAALRLVLGASTESRITWTPTAGPGGGKVNTLQISPQNPSVMYVGTDGGVCASHDGGATWQAMCTGYMVNALVVDPSDPRILYMGTYAGASRSDDGGATWSQINKGLTRTIVLSLALDPAEPSTLYAGTDGWVFKSTDRGNSWRGSSKGLPESNIWSVAVDHLTPHVLYAGTDVGVFRSTDGGQRWLSTNEGIPGALRVRWLAIDPQFPSAIYAATDSGLYRSTDAAATWHPTTGGIAQNVVDMVAIDPNETSILYVAVGAQGVWRSTDSGESWQPTAHNLDEPVFTLAINPMESGVLYAGTSRGVYYGSMATQMWVPRNEGLMHTNVFLLAPVPLTPGHLYASTGLDVYTTRDGGDSWFVVDWGLIHPNIVSLAVDPLSTDTVYAGTWYSEVYRSHDGGRSWRLVNEGLARDAPINALAVWHSEGTAGDAQNPRALYAGTNGGGVFASADGGIQWTAMNKGLSDLHVQVLTVAPTGSLYAGTNTGIYRLDVAGGSVNADLLWRPALNGLPADEVCSIVLDKLSARAIYAVTVTGLGKVYRSTDGGDSWTTIGQGTLPTNVKIQALAAQSPGRKQSILYAGTDGGMFRSADGGLTWQVINDGLPSGASVLALLVDDSSRLYASIRNSGVYTSTDQVPTPINWPWVLALGLGVVVGAGGVFVGRWVSRSSGRDQEGILERNWQVWDQHIGQTLRIRNQVGFDALANVPHRLRLPVLRRYAQEHGSDNLVLRLDPPVLQPGNPLQVSDFLRSWSAAERSMTDAAAFELAALRIAEQLCQVLGFNLLDRRSHTTLHGYVVRAPTLRLKMPPLFPIVFLQRANVAEQDLTTFRELMDLINVPSYLTLLVVLDSMGVPGCEDDVARARLRMLMRGTAHELIIMGFDDLYHIFVAKDPERRFVQLLLEQADLALVSPYAVSGPVPENMFFGRDNELGIITRGIGDGNFAVVGGRKIGKTSILTRLYGSFTRSPDYHALYLDCQAVQTYRDFCEATEAMWKVTWSGCRPERWMQLVDSVGQQSPGQLMVILLDEVDALLEYDRSNQGRLLKAFQAAAQEDRCRFIFCGGRVLGACLHDSDSTLFSSCKLMRLDYLSPRDTGRIVLEPMQGMGIRFENAGGLIQRMVDLSACHPNMVQYICQQLILQLNARGDRVVTLADLETVASSAQFSEYFLKVMWGNTTPMERLISLLMLDRPSITVDQLRVLLREHGVEADPPTIRHALDGLILCSMLNKDGQEYYFAAPAFPSIVTVTQDVKAMLDKAIQDCAAQCS